MLGVNSNFVRRGKTSKLLKGELLEVPEGTLCTAHLPADRYHQLFSCGQMGMIFMDQHHLQSVAAKPCSG